MSDYRERACTCHPDEAPKPCPQRYAYSECVLAARLAEAAAFLDALAERMERTGHYQFYDECRAMARKLRGKT
jgi:ribosomal protein S12 methylthiotransferase accessory factor YcaO